MRDSISNLRREQVSVRLETEVFSSVKKVNGLFKVSALSNGEVAHFPLTFNYISNKIQIIIVDQMPENSTEDSLFPIAYYQL